MNQNTQTHRHRQELNCLLSGFQAVIEIGWKGTFMPQKKEPWEELFDEQCAHLYELADRCGAGVREVMEKLVEDFVRPERERKEQVRLQDQEGGHDDV